MPIFAGMISALFFKIFEVLAAKLSYNVAFGLAVAATSIAGIAAMRAALSAIWAGVSLVLPDALVTGLGWIDPGNIGTSIGLVIMVDVVVAAFDYWRMTASLVIGASNR